MSRLVLASRALVLSAILVPALASAADMPAARATLERLRLTPFGEGLAVSGVAAGTPKLFHVGLLAHYEKAPAIGFIDKGEPNRETVTDRLTFDVVGGFRADSWLEVGFRLPVILQDGDISSAFPGDELKSFGVGDPELSLRALVARPDQAGVGIALIAGGSLPATGGHSFIGERGGTFSPTVALTRPIGDRVTLGLDMGATFRADDDELDALGGGDELFASFGGMVRVGEAVSLHAELLTDTGLDDAFAEDGYGVEALGALRAQLGGGFLATVGGGTGLVDAYGTPEFRVLGGLGWTMPERPRKAVEPEPLAVTETQVVKPEPVKAEPTPAYEKPTPRPVVVEATTAPAPKREVGRAKPSFLAPHKKEKLDVHFANDGTELSAESRRDLDDLVAGLGSNVNDIVWRVEGHSDNAKPLVPSRHLSRARAEAVSAYLQSKGMPAPWREDWYGPQFPVASNKTAAGRAKNRRADVTIVLE